MAFFDEIAKSVDQMIRFTSVSTGDQVEFPAFVTNFSDDYSVSWGEEAIFGRIDPIKNYQSTSRRINASFDILGKDRATAIKNFESYSRLIRMLYPVYSDPIGTENRARTIKAGPLLRIKYSNYIRSSTSDNGLLGCITGVTFKPEFDTGHFLLDNNEMVPIRYAMTFVFVPLHEKELGFDQKGEFLDQTFPYNRQITARVSDQTLPTTDSAVLGGESND